jgi:23S rRNA pseudouridine1911/1915/1917 synthase
MLDVLYEDNHCLAVNKPAGRLTQGDDTGDPNLVDLARDYLKAKYAKPGNVYVGLVHRLDRPVSGVVLVARTSKAAARLSEQFREGAVEKVYWAIVEGRPRDAEGEWVDFLRKDAVRNVVEVGARGSTGSHEARLGYRVLETHQGRAWLEIRPVTGRSHQIRVQLASRGLPIVGDRKYGARSTLYATDGKPRVALHARGLRFNHPIRKEAIWLSAPVPADWPGPASEGSRGSLSG